MRLAKYLRKNCSKTCAICVRLSKYLEDHDSESHQSKSSVSHSSTPRNSFLPTQLVDCLCKIHTGLPHYICHSPARLVAGNVHAFLHSEACNQHARDAHHLCDWHTVRYLLNFPIYSSLLAALLHKVMLESSLPNKPHF